MIKKRGKSKFKSKKIRKKAAVKSKFKKTPNKATVKKQLISQIPKTIESDELSQELNSLEKLRLQKPAQKEVDETKSEPVKKTFHFESNVKLPLWFYIGSVFAAYLFTIYISIFAALHFDNIEYMKITIIFIFVSMVLFFLISAVYFAFEKKSVHYSIPVLFFLGVTAIMIYAFKAVDASDLVKYSIMYTIIVTAISMYVFVVRR